LFQRGERIFSLEDIKKDLVEANAATSISSPYESEILRESEALAVKAYRDQDPASFEQAERFLYLIHSLNGFSPPLPLRPSLLWNRLVQYKLEAAFERAQQGVPACLSFNDLRESLEVLVKEAEEKDHSFIDEIGKIHEWSHLILYAKNWMVTAYGFVEQLAAVFQHCNGQIRKVVQENISDEFSNTPHRELRERFLKRIQVNFQPLEVLRDSDYLIEAISVLNYRTAVSHLRRPFYALGSFYSVEGVFSLISAKLTRTLPRFGLEEKSYEMFSLHAEVDADHAKDWLTGLDDPKLSDQDRAQALIGARAQMETSHLLFEKMRSFL